MARFKFLFKKNILKMKIFIKPTPTSFFSIQKIGFLANYLYIFLDLLPFNIIFFLLLLLITISFCRVNIRFVFHRA